MYDDPATEHQRAATGYLIWPLAIVDLLREPRDASQWARIHARQAIAFGALATLVYAILLSLPLILVSVLPTVSTTLIVVVYAAGILADLVGAMLLFGFAIAFSGRAARGELFAIPLITALVDRFVRRVR
jgi:uncharacterized membrane protein